MGKYPCTNTFSKFSYLKCFLSLQCSCLENPRDGGAWWAAIYGVAQSRTRLKRLSSSSSAYISFPDSSVGKESTCNAGQVKPILISQHKGVRRWFGKSWVFARVNKTRFGDEGRLCQPIPTQSL